MRTLTLPRVSSCTHCHRSIAVNESRNRGQISMTWESATGSIICFAAPGLAHVPVGGGAL